ncbi:MAG: aminotransferase class IV [Gemmatimonadaceae bacterium]|nr:aminotransferase class IV [Gemmatimonadaceae bacterium]
MLLTVNEKIVDSPASALSALDRGFLLGDGVFETLRIYAGKPFKLDDHLTRLSDACARTSIRVSRGVESLTRREIERVGSIGLGEAIMRITISRGLGLGLGTDPDDSTVVTLIEPLPTLDPGWYERGLDVVIARGRRNEFSETVGIKTTAYLDSIVAFRAAAQNGAADALFLDTRGHLSEATASNLFVFNAGALHTPPLECGAMPGITRSCVIEIAKTAGITVDSQTPLDPAVLKTADEVFLTSSIREIVPVISCDGLRVGNGKPGAVTRRMITAYSEMTR